MSGIETLFSTLVAQTGTKCVSHHTVFVINWLNFIVHFPVGHVQRLCQNAFLVFPT